MGGVVLAAGVVAVEGAAGLRDANSVAITGGTVNGTTIGGTTAAAATVTDLTVSGKVGINPGTFFSAVDSSAQVVISGTTAPVYIDLNPDIPFYLRSNVQATAIATAKSSVALRFMGHRWTGATSTILQSQIQNRPNAVIDSSYMAFGFTDNNDEMLVLTHGGNVGIGTTTPSSPLHVSGTTNDGSSLATLTQAGTGRAVYVTRNVASATRAMVGLSQLSATGGADAVLDIQQATIASNAIVVTSDGATPVFSVTGAGNVNVGGNVILSKTITAPGTTGAQTINKSSGRVNFAAAATSLVVTNSLVNANSIIVAMAATNDSTGRVINVVAGAGSFTINVVAPAAEMAVNFLVTN